MMNETDLSRRAQAAFFRHTGLELFQQPSGVEVIKHKRLTYVLLKNGQGTLAVYRVRSGGMLRRMKRWPKAIEATR